MHNPNSHLPVLDGWRGVSILAVLACHLLPLGPKSLGINDSAGLFGMAIFFCLSGFLITNFLLTRGDVKDFAIRRLCRIVPLAWLALPIGLAASHAKSSAWLPNFFFFANLPPLRLASATSHYWSLCVEMQFYLGIALVFSLFGRRGLQIAIPLCAIFVTSLRIYTDTIVSIVTYFRVDEILSGALLALIYKNEFWAPLRRFIGKLSPIVMLTLFAASTSRFLGPLGFGRPYFAGLLVGCTLFKSGDSFGGLLKTRTLAYIAEISYALYIIHHILEFTWLGTGDRLIKYAKRPLLFIVTFALAHVSTFYYERRWIAWGKRLTVKRTIVPASSL